MGNLAGRRYTACDLPIAEISRAIFQDTGRLKLISSSDYNVFAHLTAEESDMYRAVLNVFVAEKYFTHFARHPMALRPMSRLDWQESWGGAGQDGFHTANNLR